MPSPGKAPIASDETKTVEVIASQIPTDVGDCIREDAKAEDRTASYVICQILKKHYAKRVKARAVEHRRAA